MPTSSARNLRPGPHDPYNASSVKLAEATRIRLVLPGLGIADKDEAPASVHKKATSEDPNSKTESAAARAKARKKLLKIQGIASQADQAHSSVIVDEGVLAAAEEKQGDADVAGGSASSTPARSNAVRSCEAVVAGAAGIEKCSSRRGASSYEVHTATAGGAALIQAVKGKRSSGGGADAGKSCISSSRLALPSPDSPAAGAAAADVDSSVSSTRSSAPSSRRGQQSDKPHVPIWERLSLTPAEDRKASAAATQPRVFQPVAIKTFSPTLGSLGSSLPQDASWPPPDEPVAAPARGAVSSRSRSAARTLAQPADTAAAVGVPQRHPHCDSSAHHLSGKKPSSNPDLMLSSRSKSFTGGYQISNQLFEKLTLGDN